MIEGSVENDIEIEDNHQDNDQGEYYEYDILANQRLTIKDLIDHMPGPLISVVVHVIVISLISSIIIFKSKPEEQSLEVEIVEMEIKDIDEPPEPPEPPEEITKDQVVVEIERPEVPTENNVEIEVTDIDVIDQDVDIDITELMANNSALKITSGHTGGFLGGRKSGGQAPTNLKDVINKGLAWLAKQQNDDGTYRIDRHPNAKWGASVLAFLGNGNSSRAGKYKDIVKKNISIMLETQRKNGAIGMHAHATPFIALALLDACALEPNDQQLRTGAQKILAYALETQQTNGCWSGGEKANAKTSDEVDITATGWWAMALVSGRLAGLKVPESSFQTLKQTLLKIAKGEFKGKILVSTHGGMTRSYVRKVTINSTLLSILQFLGVKRSDPIIQELAGKLHGTRKNFRELNYWTMYKQGIGIFQLGETSPYWFGFVTDVITQMSKTQKRDGSWSCEEAFANKNTRKNKSEDGGFTGYWGDVGATAMAILNLQVYYRYGNVHEMYERYGRIVPQKAGSSSKKTAKAYVDDADELGLQF